MCYLKIGKTMFMIVTKANIMKKDRFIDTIMAGRITVCIKATMTGKGTGMLMGLTINKA